MIHARPYWSIVGCCRKEEEKELTDFILENKLTLKHLLCTHLHVDHVFGNGFIYKTYGLKPEANKQDVEKLPSPDEQAKLFGLRQHVENVPVEKYIVGGEIIKFGTSELQVLTVPGHSPGSVAFYNKKNGFAIVGDALFAGSTAVPTFGVATRRYWLPPSTTNSFHFPTRQ